MQRIEELSIMQSLGIEKGLRNRHNLAERTYNMQLFRNRIIQTVLFGLGVTLLFNLIGYMLFIHAFPKNAEEEQRIKQFEQVRKDRAEYYKAHPHKELSEQ
ncbi:hypothetical protein V7054_05115 [Priestia megaterium]|uniref:hypothetical protein n=1 Tax=Priestia megaterium TaxID=1404 RepID=UPI002FFEECAD